MTPLDKTLKRVITIKDRDYVITLSPNSLKLTLKGKRNGTELLWEQLVSGEQALAVALHASLGKFDTTAESLHQEKAIDATQGRRPRSTGRLGKQKRQPRA